MIHERGRSRLPRCLQVTLVEVDARVGGRDKTKGHNVMAASTGEIQMSARSNIMIAGVSLLLARLMDATSQTIFIAHIPLAPLPIPSSKSASSRCLLPEPSSGTGGSFVLDTGS
jgi:hypothetical protein